MNKCETLNSSITEGKEEKIFLYLIQCLKMPLCMTFSLSLVRNTQFFSLMNTKETSNPFRAGRRSATRSWHQRLWNLWAQKAETAYQRRNRTTYNGRLDVRNDSGVDQVVIQITLCDPWKLINQPIAESRDIRSIFQTFQTKHPPPSVRFQSGAKWCHQSPFLQ